MGKGIMRLNKLGRRKVGKKFYTVFQTTPAYVKEALEALRGDFREVEKPIKGKGYKVIILARGSRY